MNLKSSELVSVTTSGEAGSGQFEAAVSVFGNVDLDGDRVHKGSFQRAIKNQSPPPIVWSHTWSIPPIGNSLDWAEKTVGQTELLWLKGELFVGEGDKHQYADMAYAAMRSRDGRPPALNQFSFAYDVPEGMAEKALEDVDGKQRNVTNLKELYPVYEVGPCLRGVNPATFTMQPPKAREVVLAIKAGEVDIDELKELLGLTGAPPAVVEDNVRSGKYPAEVTALLLAAPNH